MFFSFSPRVFRVSPIWVLLLCKGVLSSGIISCLFLGLGFEGLFLAYSKA